MNRTVNRRDDVTALMVRGEVEAPPCATTDADVNFTDETMSVEDARELAADYCLGCPLRVECLEQGVASGDGVGVYGGRWVLGAKVLSWPEMAEWQRHAQIGRRNIASRWDQADVLGLLADRAS